MGSCPSFMCKQFPITKSECAKIWSSSHVLSQHCEEYLLNSWIFITTGRAVVRQWWYWNAERSTRRTALCDCSMHLYIMYDKSSCTDRVFWAEPLYMWKICMNNGYSLARFWNQQCIHGTTLQAVVHHSSLFLGISTLSGLNVVQLRNKISLEFIVWTVTFLPPPI